MTTGRQPDPAQLLAEVFAEVVGPWLVRCVVDTSLRQSGECRDDLRQQASVMADRCAPAVIEEMRALLQTDVDEQRTNPLSVARRAVRYPTELLQQAGIAPPQRSEFDQRVLAEDVYGLAPATWSDIDPKLHDVGIMWGAWKASVVLQRRRAEGRR